MAQRFPDSPMDAAEAALKAARPAAHAVAIVGEGGVLAQTGEAGDADWLARGARGHGVGQRSFWLGRLPKGGVYAAQTISTQKDGAAGARLTLVAITDLSGAAAAKDTPHAATAPLAAALATTDGRILAIDGRGGIGAATALQDAFSVNPADITINGAVPAKLPDGTRGQPDGAAHRRRRA